MTTPQARYPAPNPLANTRGLRRWDRQLVWLSGIGFCTLIWTMLALALMHGL